MLRFSFCLLFVYLFAVCCFLLFLFFVFCFFLDQTCCTHAFQPDEHNTSNLIPENLSFIRQPSKGSTRSSFPDTQTDKNIANVNANNANSMFLKNYTQNFPPRGFSKIKIAFGDDIFTPFFRIQIILRRLWIPASLLYAYY